MHELSRLTEDLRLPLDLDIDLRPEGKNGPLVRSLDSYRAYYERWSLTWEAQALLRARGVAGDRGADRRLPGAGRRGPLPGDDRRGRGARDQAHQGARRGGAAAAGRRPARHLKLGRGSLSDVEWLVQLLQLQHAGAEPALRTTSTLEALAAAARADLVTDQDAGKLRAAWLIASRARSAITLWTAKTADVLPADRRQLDGVARLLEYPLGSRRSSRRTICASPAGRGGLRAPVLRQGRPA